MSGIKGRSGAPGITRKAGPGALPKKFALKKDGRYGLSITTAEGVFLPLQSITVVEIDRKTITLQGDDGTRIVIMIVRIC